MTSNPNQAQEPRRAKRMALEAEVGIRRAGVRPFRVRVFDLTRHGCKMEFVERPAVNERVWVKFDGLDSLEGKVRWIDGHIGGVEFARPLYPAVFEKLANEKAEEPQ